MQAELLAQKASKEKAMERGMVDYIGIEPHSSLLILFENEENLQDEECLLVSAHFFARFTHQLP
jgi:hypothetical protein